MDSQQNNPVLVTGGRGFVGRAVVKLLQRSGIKVVSLDRSALSGETELEGCEEVACDLSDAAQLRAVFEKGRIEGIIHLAAILPTAAQRNPLLATQVNVQGGANVLEMAREFHVRRVVFGSSLSIYGTYSAEHTVSELDRAAPEDLYAAAKLYVEQLGKAYRERHGIEFVSLRIGRVVGPGAQSVTSAWRSEMFELLKVSYPAEILLPYRASERILVLHIEDVVEGVDESVGEAVQAVSMLHDAFTLDIVEHFANLLGGEFVMIEERNEASDGALEVDIVLPERVVGVDEESVGHSF